MIRPQPHIDAMSAYTLADLPALGVHAPVSLSQNESLRAPSPKALAAARDALEAAALYPDPEWRMLRQGLSELHGISADNILCGNGSLDLIAAIAAVYGGPGRAVLAPEHAYPFFRTAALASGARFDVASEEDLTVSVDWLLDAQRADTALVFVANPGNPTGTRLPTAALERLRAGLRPDVLLVIDEAYGEFADHLEPRSCWRMVEAGNTIVLRTFSKAYGLAGLRVGWGLFPPDIAEALRKVLRPNALTSVSQAAAVAALADQEYMAQTCRMTAAARETVTERLHRGGLEVIPSHTNFVLLRFADPNSAAQADAALRAQGHVLRRQQGAGLAHCLRMTIGSPERMTQATDTLLRWKKADHP